MQDAGTGKSRPICQNEFFMLTGKIVMKSETMTQKMNESAFKLHQHGWVITGKLWIKKFIEGNPKYTVITMDW